MFYFLSGELTISLLLMVHPSIFHVSVSPANGESNTGKGTFNILQDGVEKGSVHIYVDSFRICEAYNL